MVPFSLVFIECCYILLWRNCGFIILEKKKETVIQFGELEREREGVGGTTKLGSDGGEKN